jgi:hypothetical protein
MEASKPLPSVEASLKYMAWDMKRFANEAEKQTALLGRIAEGLAGRSHSEDVPF